MPSLVGSEMCIRDRVVAVDAFIPGCPPSAQRIKLALELLLNGQPVILPPEELKFG